MQLPVLTNVIRIQTLTSSPVAITIYNSCLFYTRYLSNNAWSWSKALQGLISLITLHFNGYSCVKHLKEGRARGTQHMISIRHVFLIQSRFFILSLSLSYTLLIQSNILGTSGNIICHSTEKLLWQNFSFPLFFQTHNIFKAISMCFV